jgi:hypothetical protein
MVQIVQKMGVLRDRIILLAPPMHDHKARVARALRKGIFSNDTYATKPYAVAAMEVARELGVEGIDLYKSMETAHSVRR